MIIREMANSDRPREKALHFGIESLSHVELLALLIRCGTKEESALMLSQRIINEAGGFNQLVAISLAELIAIKGIKQAKALEILGCIELAKRLQQIKFTESATVQTAREVYEYIGAKLKFEQQEKFYALFLNTKNQIIKEKLLFIGTLNMSIVHPRDVFKEAVLSNCAAVICVHNHPSGNPAPSKEDIIMTKKLVEIGEMMAIPILDHIIIGQENYYSLKANHFI